jgi:hypothetical protein
MKNNTVFGPASKILNPLKPEVTIHFYKIFTFYLTKNTVCVYIRKTIW